MAELTPTRSALLELQEERRAMREGYAFLDEKRLLLAAEIIRQIQSYEQAAQGFDKLYRDACQALQGAVLRHGLEGLQCYPAGDLATAALDVKRHQLLGVALQDAALEEGRDGRDEPTMPANPSPEANACRDLFAQVVRQAAALAALAGNLERLRQEYVRTERRTRALEDVLIPELEQDLGSLETRLDEAEREELIWGRRRG
jgi:V/A-type H+-transporting ATPase subunit D